MIIIPLSKNLIFWIYDNFTTVISFFSTVMHPEESRRRFDEFSDWF